MCFVYACLFDLIVLHLVFNCNGLFLFLQFFCVSLNHVGFVLSNVVTLDLVFFSTEPKDWLGRTSAK